MATIINITGKYRTTQLNRKAKDLEKKGFKVFKSDNNQFFSGLLSKAAQERIHAEYDYIINVPYIARMWDGSDSLTTDYRQSLTIH